MPETNTSTDQKSDISSISIWAGILDMMLFFSLAMLAFALGIIFHIWIEQRLPASVGVARDVWEQLNTLDVLKFSLAAVIVSLPLFINFVIKFIKQTAKNPQLKSQPLQRFFIYLTLFSTFFVMVGHVFLTIYEFINGTGSINTLSHLGVTFLLALPVFLFFISDKVVETKKDTLFYGFFALLSAIAIGYGIFTIPNPVDQQKLTDIRTIESFIGDYYAKHKILPDKDVVNNYFRGNNTEGRYQYSITGSVTYDICTKFFSESKEDSSKTRYAHPKGPHCFNLTIAKEYLSAVAKIESISKTDACSWVVTFTLQNFTPKSPIIVNSTGRLAKKCDPRDFADYTWTAEAPVSANEEGSATILYQQDDYGTYTYTFTDKIGKKASVTFEYAITPTPASNPSVIP